MEIEIVTENIQLKKKIPNYWMTKAGCFIIAFPMKYFDRVKLVRLKYW